MLSNGMRTLDRSPGITPAGKLFGNGRRAEECLKLPAIPKTPDQVQKFRCTTQPGNGKERIFYGRYSDSDVASLLTHGTSSRPSYLASQFINPEPVSYFGYRVNQKREGSVYASQKRAPLGRSHNQQKGLPAGVGIYDKSYGIPTARDISAGELLNPDKSSAQVEAESNEGLELYKKSHLAYTVGERHTRQYDWSRVPATSSFGVETPHDNRGANTRKTLKWMTETLGEKSAQLTSKRVDDFRARNAYQVGKVHDPIKDTMTCGPDHIHGIMVEPDEYGAGDLIENKIENPPSEFTTTYSQLDGATREDDAMEFNVSGVPTIRNDLPIPRIRRMGDHSNYGDESDAYGLMNPSIYSKSGVYENDFFKPRDQIDIRRIFDSIGVEMTHEQFLELWDRAQKLTADGHVSVESFRHILDLKASEGFEADASYSAPPLDMQTTLKNMKNNKPEIFKTFKKEKKEILTF